MTKEKNVCAHGLALQSWPSGSTDANEVANGNYSQLSITARSLTSFNFPLNIHMTPAQATSTNVAVQCATTGVRVDYLISIYVPALEAFNYIIKKTGTTTLVC